MRQQRLPTGTIAVAPVLTSGTQPLPAAVLDLDPGGHVASPDGTDLHLCGIGPIATQMPQVTDVPLTAAWRRSPGNGDPVRLSYGSGAVGLP